MRRAREAQLARLAAHSTAADHAAAWRLATLRARVKIGIALRHALGQLGIDPATVTMLRIADEAAQELAVTAEGAEGRDAGATLPVAGAQWANASAAALEARIDGSVRRYRDMPGIDFAQTSLAEALAWCLARLENSSPSEAAGASGEDGARVFAADFLQKQQQDGTP